MDYGNINLFKMMKAKVAYHSERQAVLSSNISNIDTPGYKARDLKKLDFEKLAMIEAHRLDMRITSPSHLMGARDKANQAFKQEKVKKTYETTPVENNVVLEEQMMNVADNNAQYMMTTNLYKKTVDLFKIAIGNR